MKRPLIVILAVSELFAIVCPAWAQFSAKQSQFRDSVVALNGTLDVHGVASGTVYGPIGDVQYQTDQHVSGTLKLDQYNPLTAALTGTLSGTITVSETSTISGVCTIENTYRASTNAQTDFRGVPLTFNLSFDLGSDTWSLWPSSNSINGTMTSKQTCAGLTQTSSTPNPMRFMPIDMKMGFPFAATGFDLVGTGTEVCPGCGNANSNPVTYTFTYNLKATTKNCSYTLAASSVTVTSGAAQGSFGITTGDGCPWFALPNDSWISILTGASGTGSGTVTFAVSPNTTGAPRSGSIGIGGLTLSVTQSAAGTQFYPVTPCRVADTRALAGTFGGPVLSGGSSRSFPVPQSACNIPAAALAYSLNVTVVPRGPLGFLTLSPTGQPRPVVSTLNALGGNVVANAALVPAGANGAIDVFVTDTTDVILDINGYFAPPNSPGGLVFYPVTPCRISDTRNSPGPFGGPTLAPSETRSYTVPSSGCQIPSAARAFSLNVSVVPKGPLGYLTAWPAGQSQPFISTLNSFDGSIAANAAIVPASHNGAISIFVTDATDVILDIDGYFAPAGTGGLLFYPATPCRIADTRNPAGAFGGPTLDSGATRSFPLPASGCNLAQTAQAYSLNVSVVPAATLGFLTLWPTGTAQPLVSTLNSLKGLILGNAALVGGGSNGAVSVFVTDRTDVILDINGFFAP